MIRIDRISHNEQKKVDGMPKLKNLKTRSVTLAAVLLSAIVLVGCSTSNEKEDIIPSDIEIQMDAQITAPDAVQNYAKDNVQFYIESHTEKGANPEESYGTYQITDAKIIGLDQINTGIATEDYSIDMYLLEYRLMVDNPDNVMLPGGMSIEEGGITEWGSVGQPYLLFLSDDTGIEFIGQTTTDEIAFDYGTPEMIEEYGDAYAAAAMELYKEYLN